MAHPRLSVETVDGSTQATVEDLLQLTILADGSAQIDLVGKHVEVERSGLRYVVRRANPYPGNEKQVQHV